MLAPGARRPLAVARRREHHSIIKADGIVARSRRLLISVSVLYEYSSTQDFEWYASRALQYYVDPPYSRQMRVFDDDDDEGCRCALDVALVVGPTWRSRI